VIDCCTREIVGWNLSHRCRTEDALVAVEQAVLERLPEGNIPIIRLYEGYPWRGSLLGKTLQHFEIERREKATSLRQQGAGLRTNPNATPDQSAEAAGLHSRLGQFLNSELPDSDGLVLPTRLGNVIRAFERYPTQAYGIDAIVLWPRLVGKLDAAFASTIDEAKTSFDFMLNMSFLCGLTTLFILAIGVVFPLPLRWAFVSALVLKLLLFLFLTVVFYYFSVNRAHDWGSQVKSAFDLYRFDLLKALGYQQRPLSYQEERALWTNISSQMLFPDDRKVPLPYEQSPTRLIPFPSDISVSVERKFMPADDVQHVSVRLRLINNDASRRVNSLTVIDTLPAGYSYLTGRAPCICQTRPPGPGLSDVRTRMDRETKPQHRGRPAYKSAERAGRVPSLVRWGSSVRAEPRWASSNCR